MREAVIVSYARTGLAKSHRGGFNNTPAMSMAAHAIRSAVEKSGVEPDAVEDVYLGNGAHGAGNLARLAGLLAGLPVTTAGATIQRHCSSGLNAIALAANYIKQRRRRRRRRRWCRGDLDAGRRHRRHGPEAARGLPGDLHGDDRHRRHRRRALRASAARAQDEYSLESQQRTAAAQEAGKFDDEIVPDEGHDEGRRQGDEGRVASSTYVVDKRRVQPSRRRRSRGSRSCSRSRARATSSPPATPASCPTAARPS